MKNSTFRNLLMLGVILILCISETNAQNNSIYNGGNGDGFASATTDSFLPLPIHLTVFNVDAEDNNANATWTTAMEENNRGFYLERSSDMKSWEPINFIPSQMESGNSFDVLNYSYTDMNVYHFWTGENLFYYRLRQQDFNGTEEYVGGVQVVRFGLNSTASTGIKVYPVPAMDMVNITSSVTGDYTLIVMDMVGRKIYELKFRDTIRLNLTELTTGTYTAVVKKLNGEIVDTEKIIVNK